MSRTLTQDCSIGREGSYIYIFRYMCVSGSIEYELATIFVVTLIRSASIHVPTLSSQPQTMVRVCSTTCPMSKVRHLPSIANPKPKHWRASFDSMPTVYILSHLPCSPTWQATQRVIVSHEALVFYVWILVSVVTGSRREVKTVLEESGTLHPF
jgi:hypothetical protein